MTISLTDPFAHDRLGLLDARLDESVTRVIELAATATTDSQLGGAGTEVGNIVDEMESLRLNDRGRLVGDQVPYGSSATAATRPVFSSVT